MRAYEERIIMRDILAMTSGGDPSVSAARLRLFAPMRYGPKLVLALERMSRNGPLKLAVPSQTKSRRVYHLREQARIREGVAA
jgi:hypothetical protein